MYGYDNLLPRPLSLWLDGFQPSDRTQLPADKIDVLVIGAGIAGIATAYRLTQQGVRVAIIDSRHALSGTTGNSTAKLTTQHSVLYSRLAARSRVEAELYAEAQLDGAFWLEYELNQLNVDADIIKSKGIIYSLNPDKYSLLENEARIAYEFGIDATYESDYDIPFIDRSGPAYIINNHIQLNPVKALKGMITHVLNNGGWLAENTKALSVEEFDNDVHVLTNRGLLKADHVVIATHAPFIDKGRYTYLMTPIAELVVSGPLEYENSIRDTYFSIDKGNQKSIRIAHGPDGRMHGVVLGDHHRPGKGGDLYSKHLDLSRWAKYAVGLEKITHRWSAMDYTVNDRIPFIGRYGDYDKVFVATGFGQWGMSNGAFAGLLLTDMIMGRHNDYVELFSPQRNVITLETFKNAANVGRSFIVDKVKAYTEKQPEELDYNEAVVTDGVAAYRDRDGNLHKIKSACTHLGCSINFNNGENTWDCPCHGSRFNVDGSVIHGPAVDDLDNLD